MADDDVSLIFVYGTLKRGFYNHRLIEELIRRGPSPPSKLSPWCAGPTVSRSWSISPGWVSEWGESSTRCLRALDEPDSTSWKALSRGTTRGCPWLSKVVMITWRRILHTRGLGRPCGRGAEAKGVWLSIALRWGGGMSERRIGHRILPSFNISTISFRTPPYSNYCFYLINQWLSQHTLYST